MLNLLNKLKIEKKIKTRRNNKLNLLKNLVNKKVSSKKALIA
jgi:hypothetical protein